MKKHRANAAQTEDKIRRWSVISTAGLIFLMLGYLIMTVLTSNQLKGHMEVVSDHPFEVVIASGDLQTYLSEMRIRTERLTAHKNEEDLALVAGALDELYRSSEEPLSKLEELYLGDAQDIRALQDTWQQLHRAQDDCLSFAAQEAVTLAEVERYEAQHLAPLYEKAMVQLDTVIRSAQGKKVHYGELAETLRQRIIAGSAILMGLMILLLLLYQYVLHRQRQELVLRSRLFDDLSNSIDDAFVIWDSSSEKLYYTSLNMERVSGYKVRKLSDIYQGFEPEDARELQAAACSKEPPHTFGKVAAYIRPDKEKRWMSVRIYQTDQTASPQCIGVFSDCTEEITAREALRDAMLNAEHANTAKSEFLSRMSHEIRTPLNAIIGMTTIAAASLENSEKIQDCLTKINFSSKHLLMLINDILDMSKIESSKMMLQKESFDLVQAVSGFVSTIYAQAQAKGVQFKESMEGFEGRTRYIGDPLRLNQILLNLGSNAVKFTPPGGAVRLTVRRIAADTSADTVQFIMRDTGIGMSREALERVFRPFEQANETIAGKYGGTGLGMSITQNLVALMNGRIEIQSEEGEGTTCIVDLPLVRDQEECPQPDFAKLGLRALVVDDEEAVCKEVASLLRSISIRCEYVCTGSEAVEAAMQAAAAGCGFDFCILDWKMPEMDGVATAKKIRQKMGAGLPIIMISAYDSSEVEEEARRAGVNAFLPKPLYRTSVCAAVDTILCKAPQEQPEEQEGDLLAGKRILVVEDNDLNREITQELLHMQGMVTQCAINGKEAVQAYLSAPQGHFDAILMDVQMPVMNGYEAAKQIRMSGQADAQTLPIIATTANAFRSDISAALAAGMNAHVSKPIDIQQLCQVLKEQLGGV